MFYGGLIYIHYFCPKYFFTTKLAKKLASFDNQKINLRLRAIVIMSHNILLINGSGVRSSAGTLDNEWVTLVFTV